MKTNPDSLRHQWEVLKGLPFQKKLEHIWNYYRTAIFVALCALIMIVWGIQAGITGSKEVLISGLMINTDISQDGADFLEHDYWQFCGGSRRQRVDLLRGREIHFDGDFSSQADQANFLLLSVMVSSKDLDYILCDEATIRPLDAEEILMDLRNLLPEEQLAQLDTVETPSGVVAIRLSGTEFARKYPFTVEDPCLLVLSNTQSPERVVQFVNYLLAA